MTLPRAPLRLASIAVSLVLALAMASGCSGPRSLTLDDANYPRRPRIYPIEVYGEGIVQQPHREVAVIDSSAYADDSDETRIKQLEELKKKARRMGADAIQDVRILAKNVRGFTVDERTPFPSLKQGKYNLYFMRGTAIIYESSLPGSVATKTGFTLDRIENELEPPPPEETEEP